MILYLVGPFNKIIFKEIKKYEDIGVLATIKNKSFLLDTIKNGIKNIIVDSGAYSAFTQNKSIDIDKLCDVYKELLFLKPDINLVSLDVINDKKLGGESYENYLYMLDKGLPCLPTFHYGDDFQFLEKYSKLSNYIMIGGLVTKSIHYKYILLFLKDIFIKYPNHKFHLFGVTDKRIFSKFNCHSVDSTRWLKGTKFRHIITKFGEYCLIKNGSVLYNPLLWKYLEKTYNITMDTISNGDFDWNLVNIINLMEIYEMTKGKNSCYLDFTQETLF